MPVDKNLYMCADKKIAPSLMVVMLVCIYLSDALLFTYNSNLLLSTTIPQYGLVLLAIVFFVFDLQKMAEDLKKSFGIMLLICFLLLIEAVFHNEIRGGYVSKISLFVLGYCLFDFYPQEKLIEAFKKWMVVICLGSLVGLVLGGVIVNLNFLPTITSIIGRKFYFLFLTNVPSYDFIRNYGPFTEPSRFQAFIWLALVFELFNYKTDNFINKKRILIYILTIISTFSATSYIAVGFVFVAYITSNKCSLSFGGRTALLIFLSAIVILLVNFSSGVNIAVTKFQLGEESESFAVRVNSIIGGIRVALNNPVFGTGFDNYQSEYMNAINDLATSRSHVSTNTMILYFSKFGFIVGLYYAFNVYSMLKSFTEKHSTILLFVGFFFCVSGISLLDSIIFTAIIYYRRNASDDLYLLKENRRCKEVSSKEL